MTGTLNDWGKATEHLPSIDMEAFMRVLADPDLSIKRGENEVGIFEGITHSEEIQELLNHAQLIYDNAKNKLEGQKERTTKIGGPCTFKNLLLNELAT